MTEKLTREEEVYYGDISIEKINSNKNQRHLNQITGKPTQPKKTKKTEK